MYNDENLKQNKKFLDCKRRERKVGEQIVFCKINAGMKILELK